MQTPTNLRHPDYRFHNIGSIWLVQPDNTSAADWLKDHTSASAPWFGDQLALEPRSVHHLLGALEHDGFSVSTGGAR